MNMRSGRTTNLIGVFGLASGVSYIIRRRAIHSLRFRLTREIVGGISISPESVVALIDGFVDGGIYHTHHSGAIPFQL